MNSQIGLGVFGTFGEPHGFQQVFYYGAHFRGSLDLNDNAIEFYPGADLYSIRREIVDGVHSICICVHSFAQELNTTRMGTFLGSCMVLQDGFTEADYIYKVLHSLHQDLMTNEENVADNIIKVAQGADIIIREPAEFVAVQANVIPLNRTPFFSANVDENKKYLVVPSPHAFGNTEKEIIDFIDEALKHYSDTATLYFSFDKNVYSFVSNAGLIPVLEWEQFVDRKSQMQQSTAVRTKKGIQKAAAEPAIEEDTKDDAEAKAEEEYRSWLEAEEIKEKESKDPYKPFLIWEEPDEDEVWTQQEVRYRVNEYNRLFRYANTLIDHINEPPPVEESNEGRKKRLLVAAMLLLFIGGSVAVYYYGYYHPAQGPAKLAVLTETPRTIQQSNIVTDSAAVAAGVDSAISAEMAALPENKKQNKQRDVSYSAIAADLDALEAKFGDKEETPAPVTTTAAPTATTPAVSGKALVSNNGRPQQAPATVHTHTPVATTPSASATEPPAESGAMPQINMPSSPRANLPNAAAYTGKTGPDPAWLNTPAIADRSSAMPPRSQLKPATPDAIATATQPSSPALAASTPANTKAAVQNTTATTADKPALATTQPAVATRTLPVPPATATSVAPTAVGRTNTTPAIQQPVATATQPKAAVTTPTVNTQPKAAASAPLTATNINAVTPAKQVSFNASPAANGTKATSIPATIATQPAKRDSNKPAVTGASAGTSLNTLSIGKAPISSGVSFVEMNSANAVVMPPMKKAQNPDQLKSKALYPRPNGTITQRDIPILTQMGIKNKTLTQLTQLIIDNAPEDVGNYYRGQELQYAAALLNNNRQAFQRVGDDYVCTADYLILHIPAIIKPKRPASFPK